MTLRRRQWHPTPGLLPGKSHRRRSLVGCNPWGCKESDTTEWLHFHFSLSCIGEGNGNPLQRSCLENPRDRGTWWAAVYGVAQSRTRLNRLSSSSSSTWNCTAESTCNVGHSELWVRSLDWEDALEKGMATPSSILAWRILWTEEPDRLQSIGSQKVGHDWCNWAFTHRELYSISWNNMKKTWKKHV